MSVTVRRSPGWWWMAPPTKQSSALGHTHTHTHTHTRNWAEMMERQLVHERKDHLWWFKFMRRKKTAYTWMSLEENINLNAKRWLDDKSLWWGKKCEMRENKDGKLSLCWIKLIWSWGWWVCDKNLPFSVFLLNSHLINTSDEKKKIYMHWNKQTHTVTKTTFFLLTLVHRVKKRRLHFLVFTSRVLNVLISLLNLNLKNVLNRVSKM